jgi:hypothetical protein
MNGIIDGAAPPFIMLSVAFLTLAWLPTFLLSARGRSFGRLSKYFRKLAALAVIPPSVLFVLLLIRIYYWNCRTYGHETNCTFYVLDQVILLFLIVDFAIVVGVTLLCIGTGSVGPFNNEKERT